MAETANSEQPATEPKKRGKKPKRARGGGGNAAIIFLA
jgi:hypothetical protein